ncbi:MAG TPA: NAD(P)-binding protein [Tepidisphaeraceae bacterium]|jgi:voltage-gated potassium channel Kch|nr:NAD(P)-binding protein [Tepidisphaeraceae bacterium]
MNAPNPSQPAGPAVPPAPDSPASSASTSPAESLDSIRDHAVIAGFGVPGRAVAEMLSRRKIPFCVIELNPTTVQRCSLAGVHIVEGSADSETVLRSAGIARASLFVLALPNDPAVLESIRLARQLNGHLRIIARCRYISTGMEAHRRGATEVIVEEQTVAREFTDRLQHYLT